MATASGSSSSGKENDVVFPNTTAANSARVPVALATAPAALSASAKDPAAGLDHIDQSPIVKAFSLRDATLVPQLPKKSAELAFKFDSSSSTSTKTATNTSSTGGSAHESSDKSAATARFVAEATGWDASDVADVLKKHNNDANAATKAILAGLEQPRSKAPAKKTTPDDDDDGPPPLIGPHGGEPVNVSLKKDASSSTTTKAPVDAAPDAKAKTVAHDPTDKVTPKPTSTPAPAAAAPAPAATPAASAAQAEPIVLRWPYRIGRTDKMVPLVAADELTVQLLAPDTPSTPSAPSTTASTSSTASTTTAAGKVPPASSGGTAAASAKVTPAAGGAVDDDDDDAKVRIKARKPAAPKSRVDVKAEVAAEFADSMPKPVKKVVESIAELAPFRAPCLRPGCAHPWVYSTDLFYELICTLQPNDDMAVEDHDDPTYHVTRCHKSCLEKVESLRGKDESGNKRCPIDGCAGLLRQRCYVRVNEKRVRDVKAREAIRVVTPEELQREREEKERAAAAAAAEALRLQRAMEEQKQRELVEAAERREREARELVEKRKAEQALAAERKRLAAEKAANEKMLAAEKERERMLPANPRMQTELSPAAAAAAANAAANTRYNEHGELVNSNKAIKRAKALAWKEKEKEKVERNKTEFYLNPAMAPKAKGGADVTGMIIPAASSSAASASSASTSQKPAGDDKSQLTEEEQLRLARGELAGQFIAPKGGAASDVGKAAKKKAKKAAAAAAPATASAPGGSANNKGTLDQKAARVRSTLAREDIDVSLDTCITALDELAGNVEMAIEIVRRREVMRAAGIIEDPRTPADVHQVLAEEGWSLTLERCRSEMQRVNNNVQIAMRNLRLEASEKLNASKPDAAATAAAAVAAAAADSDENDENDELLQLIAMSAATARVPQPQPQPQQPQWPAKPQPTPAPAAAVPVELPSLDDLERAQREQEIVFARFSGAKQDAAVKPQAVTVTNAQPQPVPLQAAPAPFQALSVTRQAEIELAEQEAGFRLFSRPAAPAPVAAAPSPVASPVLMFNNVPAVSLAPPLTIAVPTPAAPVVVASVAEQVETLRAQVREHVSLTFSPEDIENAVNHFKPRMSSEAIEWQTVALRLIEKQDEEHNLCKLCEDRPVSIKSVLCGHAVMCSQCLTQLIEMVVAKKVATVQCPLCRGALANVTEVKQDVKSAAQLAHERAQLLLSLDNASRLQCAGRMARSGFALRMCLLALADANDDMPAAALLLQQRAPPYVRVEHLYDLEKIVQAEVQRLIDAANAVHDGNATQEDDDLFAAQFSK
jgi:hypothetical protein